MKKLDIWIPPGGTKRRKKSHWGKWVLAPVAVLVLLALDSLRVHYPIAPGPQTPRREVAGAYHVHSTRSDGHASPDRIALAAHRAGLDFVILTDHNLQKLPPPVFAHGVLLISAVEESTPWGHLVALGTPRGLTKKERAADPIGEVEKLGGVSIIAHPVNSKMGWSDWKSAERANGLELYSGDTMWRQTLSHPFSRLLPAFAAYWLRPLHATMEMTAPQPKVLAHLMKLAATKPRVALCAQDAHGIPPPAGRAYEVAFRAYSMHLPTLSRPLPPDPHQAAKQVLGALIDGSGYCAFDALGPARGFAIEGTAVAGKTLTVKLPATKLETQIRVAGVGKLAKDGRTIRLTQAGPLEVQVWAKGPGALFGEVWRPWIVPSPLQVKHTVQVASDETAAGGGK